MITNTLIRKAISYIFEHNGEIILIDDAAAYCGLSKFYFSRIFKKETGESVYAFIKRTSIEHSAFRLKVEPQKTITDIRLDFGYSSSNFSSVFRQQYNISPVFFRRNCIEPASHPETFNECSSRITIHPLCQHKCRLTRKAL